MGKRIVIPAGMLETYLKHSVTVRELAFVFGIPKSTVWRALHRLAKREEMEHLVSTVAKEKKQRGRLEGGKTTSQRYTGIPLAEWSEKRKSLHEEEEM